MKKFNSPTLGRVAPYPSPSSGRATAHMQRAAARMKEIDKELCQLIDQAQRLSQISVPYRDNAPRGLVARVSLCMMHLGVPKDCCSADGCREKEQLAICCLCSHWACSQHRIALGPIKLDDNGRALGGMNIVCSDVRMCDEMQKWVIDALGEGVSISTNGSGSSSKAGQQLQLASIATHLWVEVLELRTQTCHQSQETFTVQKYWQAQVLSSEVMMQNTSHREVLRQSPR